MKRLLPILALLLSPVSSAVAAPAVPDDLRRTVDAYYDDSSQALVDAEDGEVRRFIAPLALFRAVDVNRDGLTDWWVDYGKAENGSLFCGTGGCEQQVYLARPGGGFDLVFATLVRAFRLRRAKGETILDVDFHGSVCGRAGVVECNRRYAWDRALARFIERPNRKGATWLANGPAPVVDSEPATWPADVTAQVRRRQDLCAAAGGAFEDEYSANDLPDLNGDGVRDWVVGPAYSYCDMEAASQDSILLPTTILVSRPGGAFTVAFEAMEPDWGIELGAPARLIVLEGEDCAFTETCVHVPWRWTGERLERATP